MEQLPSEAVSSSTGNHKILHLLRNRRFLIVFTSARFQYPS